MKAAGRPRLITVVVLSRRLSISLINDDTTWQMWYSHNNGNTTGKHNARPVYTGRPTYLYSGVCLRCVCVLFRRCPSRVLPAATTTTTHQRDAAQTRRERRRRRSWQLSVKTVRQQNWLRWTGKSLYFAATVCDQLEDATSPSATRHGMHSSWELETTSRCVSRVWRSASQLHDLKFCDFIHSHSHSFILSLECLCSGNMIHRH